MKGEIRVEHKAPVEPCGPDKLQEMKPYRVVKIHDGFMEASVGDIVIRFPCKIGGVFVLNCSRQIMFFDKSSTNRDWDSSFQCQRAFDVRSITFAYDEEDRPK